jgi:membrane protein DedA with SNARE-associated domain
MLACMLEHFVSDWGYAAVTLGVFVEGEAVLLCAGALAQRGQLSLPWVVIAAAVGSFAWGQTWFYVGHVSGRAFIDRRPHWREQTASIERWLSRYGAWLIVGFRFIAGMAIVLPVLIGTKRHRQRGLLLLDGLGALLWAGIFACVGFGMGASLQALLKRPMSWRELLGLGLLGVLSLWLLSKLIRAVRDRARPEVPL